MEPRWGGKHIKYDAVRVHYIVVLHLMYCCEDAGIGLDICCVLKMLQTIFFGYMEACGILFCRNWITVIDLDLVHCLQRLVN